VIAGIITGGAVALAVLAFAWFAIDRILELSAKLADVRVQWAECRAELAAATSEAKAQRERADYQEKRADALDIELEQVAIDGDPRGARERVLRRQARAQAADAPDSGGTGPVQGGGQDPAVAPGPVGDRLLKPGE
jgi:hypothetical protein